MENIVLGLLVVAVLALLIGIYSGKEDVPGD